MKRALPTAIAWALLAIAATWAATSVVKRADISRAEETTITRTLGFARAAARLTEAGRGTVTPHLIAYGNAVGENAPDVLRHLVVERGSKTRFGTRRPARAVWSMHGQTGELDAIDRGLSQQATDLAAFFAKAKESGRGISVRKLVELSDAEPGMLRVAAYAPVRSGDSLDSIVGVAGALVRVPAPTAELPLTLWLIGLGMAALGFALLLAMPDRSIVALGIVAVVSAAVLAWWGPRDQAAKDTAQLEARAGDWLQIQGYADTVEPVALVAPIGGLEPWSDHSELRLERSASGPIIAQHPDYAPGGGGADASTLLWALFAALLLAALSVPTGKLLHGMVTEPGAYAYTAPAVVGLMVLVILPFVTGVGLAFYRYDSDGNTYAFAGLANFAEILSPPPGSKINFWWTLGVTVLWTFLNVFLHVAIGLALALTLNKPSLKGKKFYRTLLILPWAVPNYITALMWRAMFEEHGAVNTIMKGMGMGTVAWFGADFWSNFIPCLVANVWLGFPFMMVVSLGALQSIPGGLYEAASLDGASPWQQFRNITLPLLKPALLPAVILGTI
ncbi:MAG: ABC-type sugar transport system permease subunit, partial [Myxococcota bacterium]